jgi:hypothetical protein
MLGRKFRRSLVTQRTVWPMLVVVPAPDSDQDTSLVQTRKIPVVLWLLPARLDQQIPKSRSGHVDVQEAAVAKE